MAQAVAGDDQLTAREVMKLYGVSYRSLRWYMATGKLPSELRTARGAPRRLFRRADVERLYSGERPRGE